MFKFLRTLAPSTVRPPPPFLRHNGHMRVQRVRLVRPFFTRKYVSHNINQCWTCHIDKNSIRRTQGLLFTTASIAAFVWFNVDNPFQDEEGNVDAQLSTEETTETLVEKAGAKNQKSLDGWAKDTAEGKLTSVVSSKEQSRRKTENKDESPNGVEDVDEGEKDEGDEVDEEDEVDEVDEEDDEDDEVEVAEDEEKPIPGNPVFIPLGLPVKCEASYYKGTDPEWQSFLQFARDKDQLIRVRSMFVHILEIPN